MSYREENDQVTLTMTREDYDRLLLAMGTVVGAALQGRGVLGLRVVIPLLNRINQGNPNYQRYFLPEEIRG